MRKKVFIIIITLIILAGLGLAYINIFFLPKKAKVLITRFLEQKLGREVEIKTLRYIPLTTFIINDTSIYKDGPGTDVLLKIDQAKFNFSLLPYLIKKKLISKLDLRNLSTQFINLSGSVRTSLAHNPAAPSKFEGIVKLVDFSLDTSLLAYDIECFNGIIDFKPDTIYFSNGYFNFNGSDCQLEAGLENLNEEPRASFALSNSELASQGSFIMKNNYIRIEKLHTRLANSSLDLIGDISDLGDPLLNIYGDSKLNIADLAVFSAKKQEALKLEGIVDAAVFFKGRANRIFRDSECSLKVKSDKISVQNLSLKNFDMDLRMKDGLITTPKLLAKLYEGFLIGSVNADVSAKSSPYSIELSVRNADLAGWAKDVKFGKKVAGQFSSRLLLKGYGDDAASLNGRGWVAVTDGYLWEMPILGGVANILGIPGLKSIVFKEAAGNFFISKRKMNISDLIFYSDDANLSVNGFIDFDSNLDLLVTTNMTQDFIKDSSDAARIANILIQQAGQFLGRVRVTGTLKNPQYSMKPPDMIKPVEKILKKEIGNILKDILE